jgi:hypothetical protein
MTLKGVISKVMHKKRKVQSPLERIKVSAGLGPKLSVNTPRHKDTNGIRDTTTNAHLACGRRK